MALPSEFADDPANWANLGTKSITAETLRAHPDLAKLEVACDQIVRFYT